MSLRLSWARPKPAALKGLYAHAWWTKKRRAPDIARMLKHSNLTLCAWQGAELVGFARVTTDFAYRAVLWDVIVHPAHHREGIGSRMVRAVLKSPKLKSVEGIWLFTTDKQPFYKKLGFKPYPQNLMVHRR